ncbi:PDR/VanB family oxidoreductase [Amphritea sp. 2_MG-2023]|uniref:PDR/VanB family oxidoreductase n=1 Tax=Amphritea TaxID=515417 RepID=UPI001C06A4CA|nr:MULTISPECIES: PDR/VanB family oxidoreductase [Amphritea]MBU2965818.1 PDR/VanB family oxidoreductase [Amphritea atlantica]MDO6417374.1 PDR/VanB family oxidoreductase [Amphritea sp. 2_MG-2023]
MEQSESSLQRVRLVSMRYGARDIVLYELEALDDTELMSVEPGAHLDVHLLNGMVRQYSLLTSQCDARRYVIGVKREESGRGGSIWLHDNARVGQVFEVSVPRNHFALTEGDAPVLLLAGGIGITPIFSMFQVLCEQGRRVHLHYWCRSTEHALFRELLEGRQNVTLHYSNTSDTGRRPLLDVFQGVDSNTEVYCCGPQRMLAEIDIIAPQLGSRLHVERFQGAESVATADQAFTVVLARSGSEIGVGVGESILEVLQAAGADVMYSCEQGICGACEVKVIEGEPVHCDSVRSAQEHQRRGTMMICCSSSVSNRLVLDI